MKRILILFFFIKQSYCMKEIEQQEVTFDEAKLIFDSADGDMQRGIANMYAILRGSKELDRESEESIKKRMKYAWTRNWHDKSEKKVRLLIENYLTSKKEKDLVSSILKSSLLVGFLVDECLISQYQKKLEKKKEELEKIQADLHSKEYKNYKKELLALQETVSSKSYWRDTRMLVSSVICFAILCNTLLCKKLCYKNIVYDWDLVVIQPIGLFLILQFLYIYSSNKKKATYLAETYPIDDAWAQEVAQAIHDQPLGEDGSYQIRLKNDLILPISSDDMKTILKVIEIDKQFAKENENAIKQCVEAYKEVLQKDIGLYNIFKNISQVYIPDQKEVVSSAMIEFVEKFLCWYALPSQKKLIAQHLFFNKDK